MWYEGFVALATSSAGIAFSLGYPDGERMPRDEMLAAIALASDALGNAVAAGAGCTRWVHRREALRTARTERGHLPVRGRSRPSHL